MIVDSYHNGCPTSCCFFSPIDGSSKETIDIYREKVRITQRQLFQSMRGLAFFQKKVCTKMEEPCVIYFNRHEDVFFLEEGLYKNGRTLCHLFQSIRGRAFFSEEVLYKNGRTLCHRCKNVSFTIFNGRALVTYGL
jgi:hypothetical protein